LRHSSRFATHDESAVAAIGVAARHGRSSGRRIRMSMA
jgi:hypothetical protein